MLLASGLRSLLGRDGIGTGRRQRWMNGRHQTRNWPAAHGRVYNKCCCGQNRRNIEKKSIVIMHSVCIPLRTTSITEIYRAYRAHYLHYLCSLNWCIKKIIVCVSIEESAMGPILPLWNIEYQPTFSTCPVNKHSKRNAFTTTSRAIQDNLFLDIWNQTKKLKKRNS
jgi:hypothetical protein